MPRSQFKDFRLTPDLARVLAAQRDAVVERSEAHLGLLPPGLVPELPLFPNWPALRQVRRPEDLNDLRRTDELHIPTDELRSGLAELVVVSVRTGGRLRITSRRFRYTLGVRAVREGFGDLLLAELLDHSDVQNVKMYTRLHPNFRIKIDKAVGKQLAPLAKAFIERVVDSEDRARNGGDPSMRLGTRKDKVGTCGSSGFCGAQAAACYTCMHFQPWLEAPHEKMLAWFLAERKRVADVGAGENVVAATDPSILGAQAVIAACEARKAELAGDGS